VVEDDYDGEFRYDRHPLGALQGLDPDRVVYAGTASKSLAAGLRLGWLVLPAELVEPVVRARYWQHDVSTLGQAVLADLIDTGRLDRHVRRVRGAYRARRDAVVAVLARDAPRLDVAGVAAGLHVTVRAPAGRADEQRIVEAAATEGLLLLGLAAHGATEDGGVVLGYTRAADHELRDALARLGAALRRVEPLG
jgi:GntR family transcriptional regulator/MocR family aminotransferase